MGCMGDFLSPQPPTFPNSAMRKMRINSEALSISRRKSIPTRVKREVDRRQNGLCNCGCGQAIVSIKVTYDHWPSLELRPWNDEETDTVPPANDPAYIQALCEQSNKLKTFGSKATTAGSDIHRIAKIKRILKGPKPTKHPVKSRGFQPRPEGVGYRWPKRSFQKRVDKQ